MNLRHRDEAVTEAMDAPDCDEAKLLRTHRQLAVVNRLVGRWCWLYRRRLRPTAKRGERLRVLDVGCGNGHLLALLQDWAARDGIELECVGIDLDARAFAIAVSGVELRVVSLERLAAAGERFDWVVCNHVLHHLPTREVSGFLAAMAVVTERVAVVNDLERSAGAYWSFPLLGSWFRGGWILPDGLRSIRRSFRVDELRGVVPEGWRVARLMPWRLVATYVPEG